MFLICFSRVTVLNSLCIVHYNVKMIFKFWDETVYLIFKFSGYFVSYNDVIEEFIHVEKIYAIFCSRVAFIFIDIDHIE